MRRKHTSQQSPEMTKKKKEFGPKLYFVHYLQTGEVSEKQKREAAAAAAGSCCCCCCSAAETDNFTQSCDGGQKEK